MKKFLLTLTAIFICTIAYAHTINWYVGNTILETTTCDSGESITPPTAPYKYGYHFVRWDGYTLIEYLESTGTQYIDTGYVYQNEAHKVAITLSTVERGFGSSPYWTYGSFTTSENRSGTLALQLGGKLGVGVGNIAAGSTTYILNNPVNRTTITLETYSNNLAKISNGNEFIVVAYKNSSITGLTEYIFDGHNDGSNKFYSSYKLYSFQLYDNDVLVRDFIPVLDKNGVPCMYDKVEGKFYYNAGTGQFIAGPVIGE